jgi:hypothetical protein
MKKINIAWDMETADPDDVFTLCLLSHHPFEEVELFGEKGEWGSKKSETPNAKISTKVDMDLFRQTLVGN